MRHSKVRNLGRGERAWIDFEHTVSCRRLIRRYLARAIKAKKARRWRERLESSARYNMKYARHRGHSICRNEKHDAMYCADCNEWIETGCTDAACEFCVGRPAKPLPATGAEFVEALQATIAPRTDAEIEEWINDIGAKP